MNVASYNLFEQKLIKNEGLSFLKLLLERDIKNYKYKISEENVVEYVHKSGNEKLSNIVTNYNITDDDLDDIQSAIIKDSDYNLEIEYLPTEDWEFENFQKIKEFIITIPSYEMLSEGLALFILVFPFAALFLSYTLIMVYR